jgi:peptide/nickel transport system permease protein
VFWALPLQARGKALVATSGGFPIPPVAGYLSRGHLGLQLFCFVGPFFYHTDQVHVSLAQVTLGPGTDGHPLGTDASGYDVLRRLMVAGQISLEVGIAAALLATLVGVLWGAIAGYFGGAPETVMISYLGLGIPPPQ